MAIAGRRTRRVVPQRAASCRKARQNRLRGIEGNAPTPLAPSTSSASPGSSGRAFAGAAATSILATLPHGGISQRFLTATQTPPAEHRHEGRRGVARLRVGGARVVRWMLINSEPHGLCVDEASGGSGFTENAPASCVFSVRHATAAQAVDAHADDRDVFVVSWRKSGVGNTQISEWCIVVQLGTPRRSMAWRSMRRFSVKF